MNEQKSIELIKHIDAQASDVFDAIKNGALLHSTGINARTFKHDFKVGGKYSLDWTCVEGASCSGEYLEIVPNERVRFTWHSTGSASSTKGDTIVTVSITEHEGKSQLKLIHEGLEAGFVHDDHMKGWQSSLDDFANDVAQLKVAR
jgi:uncharacterized protein YndB with AHSA1/START domain